MPNVFTWPSTPPATVIKMISGENSVVNLFDAPGIFFAPLPESLDSWYTNVVGTGEITLDHTGLILDTNADANSVATVLKTPHNWQTTPRWTHERRLKVEIKYLNNENALSHVDIISGLPGVERHMGFKIIGGMAWGSVGDNSNETLTTESQDVWVSTGSGGRSFEFIFDGTTVKFYIDDVLLGSLTTGLPDGTTDATKAFYLNVENKGNGIVLVLSMSQFKYYMKSL